MIYKRRIAIIVPVYNVEAYLEECLDSILNQSYKNIEVVLVDDGSKDNSLKICKEYAKKDNRVKVYHKKNGGVSSARNLGIKMSNSSYITFVDADDTIAPSYIETLHRNYTDCDDLVKINFFENDSKTKKISLDYYLNGFISGKIFGGSIGYLFYKRKIDYLFDESLQTMEDAVFVLHYLTKIKNVITINKDLYYYRRNDNSLTRSKEFAMRAKMSYMLAIDKMNEIIENDSFFVKKNAKTIVEYKRLLEERRMIILNKYDK